MPLDAAARFVVVSDQHPPRRRDTARRGKTTTLFGAGRQTYALSLSLSLSRCNPQTLVFIYKIKKGGVFESPTLSSLSLESLNPKSLNTTLLFFFFKKGEDFSLIKNAFVDCVVSLERA